MSKKYQIYLLGGIIILIILFFLFFNNQTNKEMPNQDNILSIENNNEAQIISESVQVDDSTADTYGLPVNILNSDARLKAFVSGDSATFLNKSFYLISDSKFSLTDFLYKPEIERLDGSSSNPYFSENGQPIFLKSDPPYHGEIIAYNNNHQYVLERTISEPDMSVSLWDLNKKELYFIAQCGTACGFNGLYWLSDSKFVIFGVERGYGEGKDVVLDSRFIRVYDLLEGTITVYSDK